MPALRIILISVDDELGPGVRAFAEKAGLTAPIIYEAEGALYEAFGVEQLPQTFVLDREGRILMEGRRYGGGRRVPSWASPQPIALLRRAGRGEGLALPAPEREGE